MNTFNKNFRKQFIGSQKRRLNPDDPYKTGAQQLLAKFFAIFGLTRILNKKTSVETLVMRFQTTRFQREFWGYPAFHQPPASGQGRRFIEII